MSGAVGECMQAFVQLCFKNHGDRMATFPAIGVADNSAEEEATAKDLMPVLFGIRETAKVSAWEKHFLPSLRLQSAGDRKIIIARFDEIYKHVSSTQDKCTLIDCRDFLGSVEKDCKSFVEAGGSLWFAQLKPGDALFLPGGSCFFEVVGKTDVVGLKACCFPKGFDEHADSAELLASCTRIFTQLCVDANKYQTLQGIVDKLML